MTVIHIRHLRFIVFFFVLILRLPLTAEDGSRLWLRYDPVSDAKLRARYEQAITDIVVPSSFCKDDVICLELERALSGLLCEEVGFTDTLKKDGSIIIGTPDTCKYVEQCVDPNNLDLCGPEGYIIRTAECNGSKVTVIAGNTHSGLLYGVFHFLRIIQTYRPIDDLSIVQTPQIQLRLLDHWDNLDGTVERGYAGRSIWQWRTLPQKINPRIRDYARANASIGINGAVLNNVNAQAEILRSDYLKKASVIANELRPYGIKIYFSVKFTCPEVIGGLDTADPLSAEVIEWWHSKAKEIYSLIPDFGGFLVKAYSEGQPGPQRYGRSHADGANMLADALRPFGGKVMWRSFVYDMSIDSDRTKCAYLEFVPLDGKFASNVFVQTKNGPIDFQPLEPFNPLFGAMPETALMMELQITQEYTGQAKHLVYLAPQWKKVLDSDTFADGPNTPVARIIDGSAEHHPISGIAGVSGIGSDANWTGHIFSQANWYAFGRLAWDCDLSSCRIAEEWTRMTFTNDSDAVNTVTEIMDSSWPACVNYMTPLGLHHIMAEGHHYGPGPDVVHPQRQDWSSTYYHKADSSGIGFDRSQTGTNAVAQYRAPYRQLWGSLETCPEEYLLWFHHVRWDYKMPSGRTLWDEMRTRYDTGVEQVKQMKSSWEGLRGKIDPERFEHIEDKLDEQITGAERWRDTCLEYFGRFACRQVAE